MGPSRLRARSRWSAPGKPEKVSSGPNPFSNGTGTDMQNRRLLLSGNAAETRQTRTFKEPRWMTMFRHPFHEPTQTFLRPITFLLVLSGDDFPCWGDEPVVGFPLKETRSEMVYFRVIPFLIPIEPTGRAPTHPKDLAQRPPEEARSPDMVATCFHKLNISKQDVKE